MTSTLWYLKSNTTDEPWEVKMKILLITSALIASASSLASVETMIVKKDQPGYVMEGTEFEESCVFTTDGKVTRTLSFVESDQEEKIVVSELREPHTVELIQEIIKESLFEPTFYAYLPMQDASSSTIEISGVDREGTEKMFEVFGYTTNVTLDGNDSLIWAKKVGRSSKYLEKIVESYCSELSRLDEYFND